MLRRLTVKKLALAGLLFWFTLVSGPAKPQATSAKSAQSRPELILQMGHSNSIYAIAFSPDGRIAATASRDRSIRFWDAASGHELRTIGTSHDFNLITFAHGGERLVAVGSAVSVWDVATGRKLQDWEFPDGYKIKTLAQDGDLLITVNDQGTVNTWNTTAGQLIGTTQIHHDGQMDLKALSSDAHWLIFRPAASRKQYQGRVIALNVMNGQQSVVDAECPCVFSANAERLVTGGGRWVYWEAEHGLIGMAGLKVWEVGTWREISTLPFDPPPEDGAIALSTNGHLLVAGGWSGDLTVWDTDTGAELDSFSLEQYSYVVTSALSGDGSHLATVLPGQSARMWDRNENGGYCDLVSHVNPISTVATDAGVNGRWLATGLRDGTVRMWDTTNGLQNFTLLAHTERVAGLHFSLDGRWFVTGNELNRGPERGVSFLPRILLARPGLKPTSEQVKQGKIEAEKWQRRFVKTRDPGWEPGCVTAHKLSSAAAQSDSAPPVLPWNGFISPPLAVLPPTDSYAEGNSAKLWETATGKQLNIFVGATASVVLDPQNRFLAAITENSEIKLWEIATPPRELPSLHAKDLEFSGLAFSPDGHWLASSGNEIGLWNTAGWQLEKSLPAEWVRDQSESVAFVAGGKWLAVADSGRVEVTPPFDPSTRPAPKDEENARFFVSLIDVETKKVLDTLPDAMAPLAGSNNGHLLASVDAEDQTRGVIWDTNTRKYLPKLVGHTERITGFAFGPKDDWLATSSEDGSTRIWNSQTGELLATLVSLRGTNEWFVVTPDGLFDGSPAAWKLILWRFGGNTLDAAPGEVFFNEFFHPRLLSEILSGPPPNAPADITQKDRRQPRIKLALVDKDGHTPTTTSRKIRVRLEVAEAPPDKDHPTGGCGVRDVRLFRDGLLVKVWHGQIKLDSQGRRMLETDVIIVGGKNELTAYAFNNDNIKSPDFSLTVTDNDSPKRKGTAYILAIGVEHYANSSFNLRYAGDDAEDFAHELKAHLETLGNYQRVEVILLPNDQATRANILTAIARLAGTKTSPARSSALLKFSKLQAAQPEDAVFIYFAGHGKAVGARFYLIPYDLGYVGARNAIDDAALKKITSHSISDIEMEKAFEGVNAGTMVLVIDACNSGQVLEAEEKRRGPMNSKGLAQLAYEKGMYILTASQAYQEAIEKSEFKDAAGHGHGVLTYALVEEGLNQGKASTNGRNIYLREWLDFAVHEVPRLQSLQKPRVFYRRVPEGVPPMVSKKPSSPVSD